MRPRLEQGKVHYNGVAAPESSSITIIIITRVQQRKQRKVHYNGGSAHYNGGAAAGGSNITIIITTPRLKHLQSLYSNIE